MEIKKYKVVCSQPLFSEEIYIDIAPYNGTTHDQIFFSRMMLHQQTSAHSLHRLYGSIYLTDKNGEISIEFPAPQARKNSLEYMSIKKQYADLTPKIISCYKQMRSLNKNCTIFIYGITEMFEVSAAKRAEEESFDRRSAERRKLIAKQYAPQKNDNYPQTPQEEKQREISEEFRAIRARRILAEKKRASQTLSAWQRFQRNYSGD